MPLCSTPPRNEATSPRCLRPCWRWAASSSQARSSRQHERPAHDGSTTTTTSPPAPRPSLQGRRRRFADAQAVPFSVVAIDLSTGGAPIGSRTARSTAPACAVRSTRAVAPHRRGRADATSPPATARPLGRRVPEAMIVVSDNGAGVAGLNTVDAGRRQAPARRRLRRHLLASPQQTSAADVALFLTEARRTLLGPGGEDVTAELYDLLVRQQVNGGSRSACSPGRRSRTRPATSSTGPTTRASSRRRGRGAARRPHGPWASLLRRRPPWPRRSEGLPPIANLATAVYPPPRDEC